MSVRVTLLPLLCPRTFAPAKRRGRRDREGSTSRDGRRKPSAAPRSRPLRFPRHETAVLPKCRAHIVPADRVGELGSERWLSAQSAWKLIFQPAS